MAVAACTRPAQFNLWVTVQLEAACPELNPRRMCKNPISQILPSGNALVKMLASTHALSATQASLSAKAGAQEPSCCLVDVVASEHSGACMQWPLACHSRLRPTAKNCCSSNCLHGEFCPYHMPGPQDEASSLS